jgi:hypothetical protein
LQVPETGYRNLYGNSEHSDSMNGGEFTEQLSEAASVTSTNRIISTSLRTCSKDELQRPECCYCNFNESVIKRIHLLYVIHPYIL